MRTVRSDGDLPEPVATMCTAEEGKTRQSEKESADINLTIKKYNLQLSELEEGWTGRVGEFMDLASEMPGSYLEAHERVVQAEEHFMKLPPDVRAWFRNSPLVLLDDWANGRSAAVFEAIGWLKRVEPAPAPADGGAVAPPA